MPLAWCTTISGKKPPKKIILFKMNILQLAWKNLLHKPLAMLLTLLLFALGIGLTAFLLLLSQQVGDKFEKNLAGVSLVVGAKGSPLQLILCNMYHIDAPTGNINLRQVRPFLNPRHPFIRHAYPVSVGDSYKGYRIVGTDTSLASLYGGTLAQGVAMQRTLEVNLGATAAADLKLNIGDTFRSTHGLLNETNSDSNTTLKHEHAQDFRVVGIFAPTGSVLDQLVLTPTSSIWAVHEGEHHEADGDDDHDHHDHAEAHEATDSMPKTLFEETDTTRQITAVLLKFKGNNTTTLNMQRNINQNTDMQAATPAIEINRLYQMLGIGEDALRSLAYLIVLVSGLSIFIALYSSLQSRRYELALMRVMGASRQRLFLLIMLEGLLLAVIGFVVGIVLSHVAMAILAAYMTDTYRYTFTGWTWLAQEWILLAAALGIGLSAAIIPAWQAYRTQISETLSQH
jgi:putative ABC transport system permease protein